MLRRAVQHAAIDSQAAKRRRRRPGACTASETGRHRRPVTPASRGLGPPPPRATPDARARVRRRATARTLARRWLLGELDGQVALPVTLVCDALGLDASVLAAAVRARTG
jgi:hypothetical protein